MNNFIKKAERYSRQLKGIDKEKKEKMLIDKFGFVISIESIKLIAKTF